MKLRKILLIGGVLLTSLTACQNNVTPKSDTVYFDGGVHKYNAPINTTNYLIKNGETDYQIVIPRNASNYLKIARDELIYFFYIATGITLNYIEDSNDLIHEKGQKYLSIGETSLFDSSSVNLDKTELGDDGLIIKTKDTNVYLVGGSDVGSLYAVYDFLKITFNYEQYSSDVYDIDTGIKDLRLKSYSVIDIPDIPLRCNNYGYFNVGSGNYDQSMYGYRMRMFKGRGYYFMPVFSKFDVNSSSATSTNTNTYVPYADYHTQYPEWFSDRCVDSSSSPQYQLCYTAHGKADKLNELIDLVSRKIEFSLTHFTPSKYPDMNVITFTMEDNFATCDCAACVEARNKYGADSGAVNVFVNRVGEKVETWMRENPQFARENFHIIFFAYNAFEEAPARYDEESKKYVPTYPEVKLRDNVGVYFAEINQMDYQQSMFSSINEKGKQIFDAWCDISDFVYYWTYQTNFSYYLYFYDSFSFYSQQMYNYIASKRIQMFFGQGQESCGKFGTTWNNLKGYIDSKLLWDSTLNETELINNYFEKMYKDASKTMMDLYLLTRSQNQEIFMKEPSFLTTRSNYNSVNKSKYYPLQNLKGQLNLVDLALTKIEKYASINADLYKILVKNIEAEAITPLYLILEFYSSSISHNEKQEYIDRLYNDIPLLSIEQKATKEHGNFLSEELKKFMD